MKILTADAVNNDVILDRLDPVLGYLMDQLTILSTMLYAHVFAKVLRQLWVAILNDLLAMMVIHSHLNPKSKVTGKVSILYTVLVPALYWVIL